MSANTYAALLRGINVGGKHKLPMKDLVEVFAAGKCKDVRTYIQSGNVVFTCSDAVFEGLCPSLEKEIEARFGFPVPVVVRSHQQLAQVASNNPYLKAGKPPRTLHVMFLADEPNAEAIAKLDPARSPGDEFRVIGTEAYLYLPNGAGNSKLTNAYFDSRLSTVGTGRNWATVLKLLEMTQP
jgi:uncharacterized protein (DUF1697 family)